MHKLWLVAVGLVLTGCSHLQVRGTERWCLYDWEAGVADCRYRSYKACQEDLRDRTMCAKQPQDQKLPR